MPASHICTEIEPGGQISGLWLRPTGVAPVRRLFRIEVLPRGWRKGKLAPLLRVVEGGYEMASDEIMTALGRAIAANWGDLPTRVQKDLFNAAVRSAGKGAREKLAAYLHEQHPRTIQGEQPARQVPEPDSLGG